MNRFTGKTIVIIGASGGLGAAIARAFAAEGAALALAARAEIPAEVLAGLPAYTTHQADLTDPASLAALCAAVLAAHGQVDGVINAAGWDVRKPFEAHTPEDFRRTLEVNLLGAMQLTHTFLPVMQSGVIMHLGGFADGRLALPFYSANAAARAGLRSFCEALNRELALAHRPVVAAYFSPAPADTAAERPFHELWRHMGTVITTPAAVAAAVVNAAARREKVHIMGGWATRGFAALNAAAPGLADCLLLNGYGEKMARFFGAEAAAPIPAAEPAASGRARWRTLGLALVVFSFVAYALLLGVPFLPLPTEGKLLASTVLVGAGEAAFWVGGALLGKEVIARLRRSLDPRRGCRG